MIVHLVSQIEDKSFFFLSDNIWASSSSQQPKTRPKAWKNVAQIPNDEVRLVAVVIFNKV